MAATTFKDLIAWQKAHQLVLDIYKRSSSFPADERFGLTSQVRRAAVSVAANLAEGFRKRHKKEKIYFYSVSQTSLEEVRYYLILGNDLGYWNQFDLEPQLEETSKLIEGLIQSVERSSYQR